MKELERLLAQLIQSGKVPPELLRALTEAQNDPAKLTQLTEQLKTLAGPGSQNVLNTEDYYTEGDGARYQLRWPLSSGNPLRARGIPWDLLDRKTQFFTLFAEWQRRETDGMFSLNGGSLDEAETIFAECVERARQIEVGELLARSYEDLARVAERRGDQEGARGWLENAAGARRTTG